MKLRLTYKQQTTGSIEVSLDTDINTTPFYTKTFANADEVKETIDVILEAAELNKNTEQPELKFEEEYGSLVFDVDLDFSQEEQYKQFCEKVIQNM